MAYQTINPATGQLIKTYANISDRDLEAVVAIAYKAFRGDWQYRRVTERARILSTAAAILRSKSEELQPLSNVGGGQAYRRGAGRGHPFFRYP